MTLKRQLVLTVLIIFLLVFSGTFFISIHNTYNFVNQQLATHAQDTATSLGLSLSHAVAENDSVTISRMVDAIFDSGYYQNINITKNNGEQILNKTQQISVMDVPSWFINLVPINTPLKTANIMDGWQRTGVVSVSSNPGFAYSELWSSSTDTLWLFLSITGMTLLVGLFILHFILKPLKLIVSQANAICNRNFTVQEQLPWTPDLKSVVMAMNKLSTKLKQMFEEEAARTEKFREDAYKDPVTNLGNRRFMNQQLQYALLGAHDIHGGGLAHVELVDFKAYNDKWGFEAGDLLLRHVADELTKICHDIKDVTIARMQGAGFTILLPNIDNETLVNIVSKISTQFSTFKESGITEDLEVGHIGGCLFVQNEEASEVLAKADMALRAAQTKGVNEYSVHDETSNATPVMGAMDWGKVINTVINNKNAFLYFQVVQSLDVDADDPLLHNEALLRLPGADGKPITAGAFWPMAERLKLTPELDKLAIELTLEQMDKIANFAKFAVNVSINSLLNEEFLAWLYKTLSKNAKAAKHLVFELPEYTVVKNLDFVKEFADKLKQFGASLALDHFGQKFYSFAYLKSLELAYVKIDGSFIRGIDKDENNQFYVNALTKVAHSLDILVIAESVETNEELQVLIEKQIDGIQGYLIGRPEPLGA